MAVITVKATTNAAKTGFAVDDVFKVGDLAEQKLTEATNAFTYDAARGYKFAVDADAAGKITFKTANKGEYEFETDPAKEGKFVVFDASEAVGAIRVNTSVAAAQTIEKIKTGSGADSVMAGPKATEVKVGTGKDTVELYQMSNSLEIDLGEDADADQLNLKVIDVKAAVTVKNYNYDVALGGDKVEVQDTKISDNLAKFSFVNDDGDFMIDSGNTGSNTTILAASEAVHEVAVAGTSSEKYVFAMTAKNGQTYDASAANSADAAVITNYVVDASKVEKDFTLVAGKTVATATSGTALKLNGTSADSKVTVDVSKAAKANVTLSGRAFDADDTIVLNAGTKISAVYRDGQDVYNGKPESKDDQIKAVFADAATDVAVNISLTGKAEDAKLAVFAGNADAKVDYNKYAEYYIGNGDTKIDMSLAGDAAIVLDDTKMARIAGITGITAGAAIGSTKAASTLESGSLAGKTANFWGGSADNDTLDFTNGEGKDVAWFGATDGYDVVKGFKTDDVLFLYDKASLSAKEVSQNGAGGLVIADGTTSRVTVQDIVADANGALTLDVMFKDGTVKRIKQQQANNVIVADAKVDVYMVGEGVRNGRIEYGNSFTDAVAVNLWDTDKYQNILDVDTSGALGGAVIIGSKDKGSRISTGIGTNQIWGGSDGADTINVGNGAGSKDTIWFGLKDGKDVVNNFERANDTVFFYNGLKNAADLRDAVSFGDRGADIVFKLEDGSQLKLVEANNEPNSVVKVQLWDEAKGALVQQNMLVSSNGEGGVISYKTDAKIYVANNANQRFQIGHEADSVGTLALGLGKEAQAATGYYFNDKITTIDASGTLAKTVLIGGTEGAVLWGGATENQMWGGSAATQTMNGNGAGTDVFWFGKTDGADTINRADERDTVFFYDVADINELTAYTGDSATITVAIKNAGAVILNNAKDAVDAGLTFMLQDGSAYTLDSKSGEFAKKA